MPLFLDLERVEVFIRFQFKRRRLAWAAVWPASWHEMRWVVAGRRTDGRTDGRGETEAVTKSSSRSNVMLSASFCLTRDIFIIWLGQSVAVLWVECLQIEFWACLLFSRSHERIFTFCHQNTKKSSPIDFVNVKTPHSCRLDMFACSSVWATTNLISIRGLPHSIFVSTWERFFSLIQFTSFKSTNSWAQRRRIEAVCKLESSIW